jgi:hypothetical protein
MTTVAILAFTFFLAILVIGNSGALRQTTTGYWHNPGTRICTGLGFMAQLMKQTGNFPLVV